MSRRLGVDAVLLDEVDVIPEVVHPVDVDRDADEFAVHPTAVDGAVDEDVQPAVVLPQVRDRV